mgnify:FL=1
MSRKYWLIGALILVVALIAGGAYAGREPYTYARMATGYAAKETCSCLHVSGRPLESCLAEFPQEARRNVTVTPTGNRVRASVLFGAVSANAEYEDGYGCRLLD